MTPDEFRTIVESIYGKGWRKPAAAALDVSERQMRRWMSGETPIKERTARSVRSLQQEFQKT